MKELRRIVNQLLPLVGIILIILLGCKKDETNESVPSNDPPVYENGEGEIGAIGGIITIADSTSPIAGAFIEIPEGALLEKVNIKISEAPGTISFPMNPQMKLIKFEPEGLIFDKPIIIKIPYSNITPTDGLCIFHYNAETFEITQMPKINIDQTNKLVVGETNHFSYYTVWDKDVVLFSDMLNINNKIGLRLFIEDLKNIPTNPDYSNLNGIDNAWDAVLNGPSPLYVVFIADLYTENSFWQQAVSSVRLHIKRGITGQSVHKAQIYTYPGDAPFYETGALSEPDMETWFSGKPLIFNFKDYTPDHNEKYFTKIRCVLSSDPTGIIQEFDTPFFEFNNQDDMMTIGDMQAFNNVYEEYLDAQYISTTPPFSPCTDLESVEYGGKIYTTTMIGSQCWMRENLDIGVMIDGSVMQTNDTIFQKYCFDNDPANCEIYGGLYLWDEAMYYSTTEGDRGICPDGWHIPSDSEWKELEGTVDSLYGVGDPQWDIKGFRGFNAGKRLKSTTGWNMIEGNGTDAFGFQARPGGFIISLNDFWSLGGASYWWTSTETTSTSAWNHGLISQSIQAYRNDTYKSGGRSVRCIANVIK